MTAVPGLIEILDADWRYQFRVLPGYDKRPKYGMHGMHLEFAIMPHGKEFAHMWNLYTGWAPRSVTAGWDPVLPGYVAKDWTQVHSWDWGRHSQVKLDEYDTESNRCDLLPGGRCWSMGSVTEPGAEMFLRFCTEGLPAVWEELRKAAEETRERVREQYEDFIRYS